MSPVGSPSRTRRDQHRRSRQQQHPPPQNNAVPTAIAEHDESLVEDDTYSANPLAFTPGLFHSLDAINDVDDGTFDQFKANLDQRDSHSPPGAGQTRSTVSPDPSGAPFGQRRRSSERDNIPNTHDTNSPTAFGEAPPASNGSRPMPSGTTARSDGGSESITIVHPPPAHPSPSLSGAVGPPNAFDVSFNGPLPPSQFGFANPAHAQQPKWMQSAQASDPSTSTPFDPSHVINFDPSMLSSASGSGSPPFPEAQQRQHMIRSAVMQGMQSRTQSKGPLHISTPNGNNLATTALQTHPGLSVSVSPSYPPEFTFPANRDSGGVHAAADGTTIMGGIPPSGSSPSPSPSFSSSSVSTPVYNGPNPNFIQSGNAAVGSSAAPPPPPALHHPNPHKVSQSSLRPSSRPSPTPESGPSRELGHPYPSANRHGRSRRHPSDPNQPQAAQQHGGVAPDMAVYAQRRTSCGPAPMQQPRMTARRPGMSPPNAPAVVRQRYEQDALMSGGPVRLVDPTTGQQPIQFANVQQWAHGVQPPQSDQSLNSPPSNGAEYPRTVNCASSSASLTPGSDSSLAGWNSTEDLQRFGQQGMEIQSPVGEMETWSHWTTMNGEPSMLRQSLNGSFDASLAGLQDGAQYYPVVGGMAENAFFQEGVALNGQSQSPKQFGQVSPSPEIQMQPRVWGPHALPASMGLQQ